VSKLLERSPLNSPHFYLLNSNLALFGIPTQQKWMSLLAMAGATAHRSLSRSILLETHGELLHKAMLINILMAPPTRVLAAIRRVV